MINRPCWKTMLLCNPIVLYHIKINNHARHTSRIDHRSSVGKSLQGAYPVGRTIPMVYTVQQGNPAINTIAQFPFGEGYLKEMNITELKPSWLVKWTCVKGTDEWLGTNISFTLLDGNKESLMRLHPEMKGQVDQLHNDTATMLIFNHDNWKNYTLRFGECSYTWALFLRSLKLFCETGKGNPWPQQHIVEEAVAVGHQQN